MTTPSQPTFALSLEDAEFVVEELPQRDEFTRLLRAWCEQERAQRVEAERRDQERWDRLAPIVNRLLWNVVTGASQ